MMQKGPKTISMGWISYALNIILIVVCMVFYLQNKKLKHAINSSSAVVLIDPLRAGDRVAPFHVTMLAGGTNLISYGDETKKYLFFVLTTSCPHCLKTLPIWNSIAKTHPENCEIIGISLQDLDQTREYIESKDVGFYLGAVGNDSNFGREYKISGVPETILVEGSGIVESVWLGELTNKQTREIEDLMGAQVALNN